MRLFPTAPPFVCRCCCCWPISYLFLFSFLPCSAPLTFRVASLQATPAISISPGISPLTTANPPTATPLRNHSHFDHKIIFPLTASLLLLLLLATMGCLAKFLRIKFRRRPSTNQIVVAVADTDDEREKDYVGNGGVRTYSWDEMEKLTMNFSRVIGSGGFSTVFLANLPDSALGAIKIQIVGDHLNRLFKQELDILLSLRHDYIVKLLGYCDHQEKGALVFEYVPNGSLHDKLQGAVGEKETKSPWPVLSWRNRMAIAFQLAQALEYLHEKCPLQIVHGDIKASNILLDENLSCKLCDFGSAKMGFSSAIMPSSRTNRKQVMMGSPGYTDPHYLRTGIASKKNDVYSYGVIILELVTGMEAFCEVKSQLLTTIMGPMLRGGHECETTKVAEMVDPRLAGDFDVKEVRAMISLSALCLGLSPTLRPSATQILQTFQDKIPSISFLPGETKIYQPHAATNC